MSATARWVIAIVGLLVGNGVAVGVLIATSSAGGAHVIPGYYDRAARYDDALDEARASRALGWRAEVVVDGARIEVRARDRAGAPLLGARVRIEGRSRARAAGELAIDLEAAGDGRYVAPHPPVAGWADVVIAIERDGRRYVQRAVLELP